MKKSLLTLFAIGISLLTYADGETTKTSKQVVTNGFWDNWFVSINMAGKSFYSDEEELKSELSSNPFKSFRTNFGFSTSVGKWFSQDIGLRTKFTGLWGKNVISDNSNTNAIIYWNLQEQVLFNIHNLLLGYKENRVWNLIPYAGVGVMRNCSDNQYAHGLSVGLVNTWSLSKCLDLNLDCGFFISDDDIDDKKDNIDYALSFSSADRAYYVELGIVYHLGRNKWKKAAEYEAALLNYQNQINSLNNNIAVLESEKSKLQNDINELANKSIPEPIIKKELIAAPVSVFFSIGSYEVASKKDLQNVEELVKIAINHNAKLIVEGYADSQTGPAESNQILT